MPPSDNLYDNSTVAMDTDTGEMKWYFQYTPGDFLDYDEVGMGSISKGRMTTNHPELANLQSSSSIYVFALP